jgi:hypothetical protein
MKMRTRIAGTGLSAMLTIIGCGAMTILVSASVSACTGRSGPVSAGSSSFSPGESTSPRPPESSSGTATGSASPKAGSESPAAGSGSPGGSSSASPAQAAKPNTNQPPAAPATGGGGTSGLRDPLLFVLGGAAVLAGAGSIAYRRKVTRNR